METKKQQLIRKAKEAKLKGDAMGLLMKIYDYPRPEVIANPAENIDVKIKYIDEMYDDELIMVANRNIQIIDYYFISIETLGVYK